MISIIIPTYNSKDYIAAALRSFGAHRQNGCEIVVIDNGSQDGTAERIEQDFPLVKVLRNQKNKGASFARNQGIAHARGEWILFADCDIEFSHDFLQQLSAIIHDLSQDIAAISPQILDASSRKIFSCGLFISRLYRTYDMKKGRTQLTAGEPFSIHGPNSCCAVVRRRILEQIKERNYFDEDFFFLGEDADVALRLKHGGHKCLCIPNLVGFHHGSSSDFSPQRRRYFSFRNRIYMIIKHHSTKDIILFFLRSFIYDIPRSIHFFLTNRYAKDIMNDIRRKWKHEKTHPI